MLRSVALIAYAKHWTALFFELDALASVELKADIGNMQEPDLTHS